MAALVFWILAGCGSLTYYGDALRALDAGDSDTGATTSNAVGTDDSDETNGGTLQEPPDDDGVQLQLDEVTPDFGTNGGGTEVVLSGTFDDQTDVGFGGVDATVLSRSSSEITAIVPASAVSGLVDVTVTSGSRSATLPDGFEYWADASGSSGTFGSLEYYEIVGDYLVDVGGNPAPDFGYAQFGFIEPSDWEFWHRFGDALDSCRLYEAPAEPTFVDIGADEVEFSATGATASLDPDGTEAGLFVNDDVIPGSGIDPNATYDLHASSVSAGWPISDLTAAVSVAAPFDVTSPDIDSATAPTVSKNTFDINWTGSSGDEVVIWVGRREPPAGLTVVTCVATDDGGFRIPGTVWPTWAAGQFMDIFVGRVLTSGDPLPHDGSENRMAGVYWVYGGAYTN